MIFRTVTTKILVAAFLLSSLSLTGCTRSSGPEAPPLRAGQAPFQFEVKSVGTLEIAKADPKSGDAWTARFRRAEDGQWEIASAPGGSAPLDRKAHSTLIDHLLDSLRMLRVKALAPKGPLESFELAPPHLAMRWNGTELRIGTGNYVALNGTVYEMEGAALKIVEYADSFHSLRQLTWLYPLASDDVDEVEIFSGKPGQKSKSFYAQREGAVWTDRQHKPIQKDVTMFLEQLTHLRIQSFIDDADESAQIVRSIQKTPLKRVVLKDRHGNATELGLRWRKPKSKTFTSEQLLGVNSSRPGASFQLYAEALRFFEGF